MTNPTNRKVDAADAAAYALSTWGKTLEGTIEVDRLDAYGVMNDYDAVGGWQYGLVGPSATCTKTRVYTKYLTGITDDAATHVTAHGISGMVNILSCVPLIGGYPVDGVAFSGFVLDSTDITMTYQVGLKGLDFSVAIHYIV
jgi:hypothetical protein